MRKASLAWNSWLFCTWTALSVGAVAIGADSTPGPTDWSDWQKYRDQVVHPATIIKPQDLARARENIRRYAWAQRYVERLLRACREVKLPCDAEPVGRIAGLELGIQRCHHSHLGYCNRPNSSFTSRAHALGLRSSIFAGRTRIDLCRKRSNHPLLGYRDLD